MADPTRRRILARVSRGPLSVGQICEGLPMTRPAVSQHLRVLRDAGLVTFSSVGTKRMYAARPDGLDTLRSELDRFWSQALLNFERQVKQRQARGTPMTGEENDGQDS
jgi:DNA-binding transcriptional ArsR family regulator